MHDLELQQLFRSIILANLASYGITDTIAVEQAYQPTLQGVNSDATIYFFKIANRLYGYPREDNYRDPDTLEMKKITEQYYETTYQFNALVPQDPANLLGYTASDLVNTVALILQNRTTLEALKAQEVGILRITEVRNPYFQDDKNQFEANPSFDCIFTHKNTRVVSDTVVESVQYGIYGI